MPKKNRKEELVHPSIVRNLPRDMEFTIAPGVGHTGDLVAVEIQDTVAYPRVELPTGRLGRLYKGDVLIGALGPRRGTKEYCGIIPKGGVRFRKNGGTDHAISLLVEAGVVGVCTSCVSGIAKPPSLRGVGLLWKDGEILNLRDIAVTACDPVPPLPPLVVMVGSAMEVGKTTCAAACIHGLKARGYKVAAVKLTGVAMIRDILIFRDAGAVQVRDFVDAGIPITYTTDDMPPMAKQVIGRLTLDCDPEVVVVELGAGLLLPPNQALLKDAELKRATRALLLAAGDETGAVGGVRVLKERFNITPCAIVGPICDTDVGLQYIHDNVKLPGFTWREEDKLANILVDRLRRH